jgi:hypothetical protein
MDWKYTNEPDGETCLGAVHVLLSRFYPDFIQILSWFYPDFIQILARFCQDFLKTHLIQILSRLESG